MQDFDSSSQAVQRCIPSTAKESASSEAAPAENVPKAFHCEVKPKVSIAKYTAVTCYQSFEALCEYESLQEAAQKLILHEYCYMPFDPRLNHPP